MSRSRRVALATTAALLALTACSSGGAEESSPSDSSSASPQTPDANVLDDELPDVEWGQPLSKDVTEAELRTWVREEKLPEAPSTGGLETMLNSIAFRKATPDVTFFGDSMTQQGLDPQTLRSEMRKQTGRDVTAFNAASSRARWGVNKLVAKYLERHHKVPKVAVLVISTRAAEGDLYYKKDVAHTPLSSVVEGCDRERSELWTAEDARACEQDRTSMRHRFRNAGGQVERAQAGEQATTSWQVDEDSILRSDGYLAHPSMTTKQVQSRSDKRVKRGFPGFPAVQDEAVADFKETAEILERNGAKVISVELPYSPPHQKNLEQFRDYDKRRQAAAKELARRAGVKHHPVKRYGSWWGDGDSRDEIHLAPHGAAGFTKQLVNDVPGFREDLEAGLDD